MTGLGIFHAQQRDNVACLRDVQFLTRVSVHFNNAANTLGLAGISIKYRIALVQGARINARKGERTVTVVHNFECKRAQRATWVYSCYFAGFVAF